MPYKCINHFQDTFKLQKGVEITGVHPCSCNSPNVRGGVGITWFAIIHVRLTTPAAYKRSKQYVFEKNIVKFLPNLDQFFGT